MKSKLRNNKGVTIIALAITIIVLLILAGISIMMLTGDNGIIKEANKSKEQVEIQAEKENIDMSIVALIGEKRNGKVEITDRDKLEQKLRNNYNSQKIDVSIIQDQGPYIFGIEYLETKRKYYVTAEGDVTDSIELKLVIEYKTSDGTVISRKLQEYTNENINVGKLELSEEIKKKNNYEFERAEIEKLDGSKQDVKLTDTIALDKNIKKVIIIYNKKIVEDPKYTLTINPGQGSIVGETTKTGKNGEQITISTPTAPLGYKITLNGNGGSVSQVAINSNYTFDKWTLSGGGTISGNTYTFGTQDGTLTASYNHIGVILPTPTREGYTFLGWYTSVTGGSKVGDAGSKYVPTGNVTIYARWEDKIAPKITRLTAGTTSITIEATDSGTGINKYAISTSAVPGSFVSVGKTNNLNITVSELKENTTYYVWVKDEAGNQSEHKTVTTSAVPRYTLTINPGQGSITGETTKTGKNGEQITIPAPTSPSGYTVTLNGNGGKVSQTSINSNYTFNKWTLSGGGTISGNTYTFGNQNGTITASYSHVGVTLPTPTREGYTFLGWYTSSTGGSKVGDAGNIYTPSGNITIYARWEDRTPPNITRLIPGTTSITIEATDSGTGINRYAISTNSVPGSFITVGKTNNLNIAVSGLNEGTTYYVWVKDEAGNQSEYKTVTTNAVPRYTLTINPGQGSITGGTTKIGKEGDQVIIPTPTSPSGYRVTFNANGGNVNQTSSSSYYSFNGWSISGGGRIYGNTYTFGSQNGTLTANYSHIGITLPRPTKEGYTFLGWYTSSTGGSKVGDAGGTYTPTGNTIIYARWEDRTAPNITRLIPGTTSITIEATDSGTGINGYAISTNSFPGSFITVGKTNNLNITVSGLNEGTTYYVWVKDEAGNKSAYKTVTTNSLPRYTLTINPGQGSISGGTIKTGKEGEQVTIPTPTSPSGYRVTFNANGGNVNQTSSSSYYSFNGWSISGGGRIYGNTYTFGSQNGTLTANYSHIGITLPRPTKEGYTFLGWYTSSTGGSKVGDAGGTYTPTGNTTIYARWQAQIPSLITNTNVWFTPDVTRWTNQDVNVSVRTSETKWTLQLTTGNPLDEYSWVTTNRIAVKQNGTIYARLTDGYTSGGHASYNITNIDKTPPTKMQKGMMAISRDQVKREAYLQLNAIKENESGIAKIDCYYKTDLEYSYNKQTMIEFAPMYGNTEGYITGSQSYSYRCVIPMNDNSFTQRTIKMYVEISDVAGNVSKGWVATISPDGKQTSYTENY